MKEKEKEIRSQHRTEFELKDRKLKATIDIARKKVEEDRILNEKKVRQMEEDMKSGLEAEKQKYFNKIQTQFDDERSSLRKQLDEERKKYEENHNKKEKELRNEIKIEREKAYENAKQLLDRSEKENERFFKNRKEEIDLERSKLL